VKIFKIIQAVSFSLDREGQQSLLDATIAQRFFGHIPESQGHILPLIVLCVSYLLDSGGQQTLP